MRVLVSITLLAAVSVCLADSPSAALTADGWVNPNEGEPNDMVLVPGGVFEMGDMHDEYSCEQPVHTVTLSSFYMSRCEITNGQYCEFLNSALAQGLIAVRKGVIYKAGLSSAYPYCEASTSDSSSQIAYSGGVFTVRTKGGRSMVNDPMVLISWYGAVAYCNWRSQQEGREPCYNLSTWACDFSKNGFHLPTEAQWEYAARGGLSGKRFPWGDTIDHSHANYVANSNWYTYDYDTSPYPASTHHPTWDDGIYPYTSPVGSFPSNAYGLCDVAGNVHEWCNDWYECEYYTGSPTYNPRGPARSECEYRVIRGGSWASAAPFCRVAERSGSTPKSRDFMRGFRVSLGLD